MEPWFPAAVERSRNSLGTLCSGLSPEQTEF
jgi:hypothetical protein